MNIKRNYLTILSSILLLFVTSNIFGNLNYDTAWTFVYNGGTDNDGDPIDDIFYDAVALEDGSVICVGKTGDSTLSTMNFFAQIDKNGSLKTKKILKTNNSEMVYNAHSAHSICRTRNGDLVIGGDRFLAPYIIRMDTNGVEKWSAWLYDSTVRDFDGGVFQRNATVNSVFETSRGTIICAAGDEFPNNDGYGLENYSAFMEVDSQGTIINYGESKNMAGYTTGGFSICETGDGKYILAGNQAVICLDTSGAVKWEKKYTYMLEGVGSTENTVFKVKVLRNGTLMVVGQAYEGNCWTRYNDLYRDAWWSPISYSFGENSAWDTAGAPRGDDILYNFTQLIDGKLVFIGTKATIYDSGMWVLVTDSMGSNILWEKQYMLPGVDSEGNKLDILLPLSVCATPDSGFTIVGDNNTFGNNHNAFVFHFTPAPPVVVKHKIDIKITQPIHQLIRNKIISINDSRIQSVIIFTVSGKTIERVKNKSGIFRIDCSRYSKGVYVYQLKGNTECFTGKFIIR